MADEHDDAAKPQDRAPADGASDEIGAALDGIEAALDEIASALARMA